MKISRRKCVLWVVVTAFSFLIAYGCTEKASMEEKQEVVGANIQYLADVHKAAGDCSICHRQEQPQDDNLSHENENCIDCHGDLKAVAAEERQGLVSPHISHLIGEIACTTCHKGHQKSVTYCDACHSFDYKMPFGGTWERTFTPVDADRAAQKKALRDGPRQQTDIVVIGTGGAGLSAAVAARDLGAEVIVLEKEPVAGGNTKLAAGGMNAAGTHAQKALGIKDSPETMIEDTLKGGKNINDPELVTILAKQSSDSVDWLTKLGADLSDVGRMGGASVNRTHRPTGGGGVGAHVAQVLWESSVNRDVDIRFNSRAVQILLDEKDRVAGVLVHGEYTGYYVIAADAVVLATGGFSKNNDRVAAYDPALEGFKSTNHPGATGDGLDVAMGAGAAVRDLEHIQAHPTYSPKGGVMVTEAVRGNGAVLVNREGNRFINEIATRDKVSAAILSQKGESAYLLFDESIRKSLKQIEGYLHLKIVNEAEALDGLAAELDIPAAALAETVRQYNTFVASNNDPLFGRPDMPRAIDQPPYYAIEVAPAVHHTMGGVVINRKAEVKDREGGMITGLYAAGEVTGGVHGANRLGGNAITDIVTFGRIAGTEAAEYIRK